MKKVVHIIVAVLLLCPQISWAAADHRVKVYADFDKPIVQAGVAEHVVIKVGLSADNPVAQKNRIPLNLAIVLDKSGSMSSQNKIENARSAAIDIIERLQPTDIVALIVYDTAARVIMPAQPLTEKEVFVEAIRRIQADGSTALYDGINLGAREILKNASSEYLNRIILLSDGLANVGPQSTPEISGLGESLASENISTTTVGVGTDYNEDLMGALASAGGGNVYFAQDSDRIPEIFANEVGEALTMAARDVRIKLECAAGVTPVGIIGKKGQIKDRTFDLTISNLYGIKEKSALFEVQVPSNTHGRTMEIAQVTIQYFDPFTQDTVTERRSLSLRYDNNPTVIEKSVNKNIAKDIALTRNSEAKQRAVQLADQGRYQEADGLLQQNAALLDQTAKQCDNDKDLLAEAQRNKSSSWSDNVQKGKINFFRKRMQAEAQSQIGEQYWGGYADMPTKSSAK